MEDMTGYTCSYINALAAENRVGFIRDCEKKYEACLDTAAKTIAADRNKKLIMLAGPSSSGKTTGAKLLSEHFGRIGCKAYIVSLDNFYFGDRSKYPLDEFGAIDFETVYALDIELIHDCFSSLLKKGLCEVPVYNFHTSSREEETEKLILGDDDVVIVEGLHALNPVITDVLPHDGLYKIYTSVSSRVYDDDGDIMLTKRDLRLVRRMVRDYQFRSSSVEDTLEMWPSVMRGEDKYLFPFKDLSDYKINSFHPCEPCVLAPFAKKMLGAVGSDSPFYENASSLNERLGHFDEIDAALLSGDCLLREFTGR